MPREFAIKFRELIDRRDVTDSAVARAVAVSPSAIGKWTIPIGEHGAGKSIRRPTVAQVLALSRSFGVTMEYLADDHLDEPIGPTPDDRAVLAIYHAQARIEGPGRSNFEEYAFRIRSPRPEG